MWYRLPTWEELSEWVSEKPDDATIGFSHDMLLGPLNLYYAQTVREAQGKYWMIGYANANVLMWDKPEKYQEMYYYVSPVPEWLKGLILKCDDLANEGYPFIMPLLPITVKMFKQVLDDVKVMSSE